MSGAATTAANANGWYTGAVKVGFTATDALSGVATTTAEQTLSADGANQSVEGKATDNAGNEASTTVTGINIDSTKPVITVNGFKSQYTLGEAAGLTCTATDATSGLDTNGCKVTTTGGTANGVGSFTYTATATDKAGNKSEVTGTYKVVYKWSGFLQPINDTAHQVGASTSIFKAVSTVPAKFQLRDVNDKVVQASSLPEWVAPAKSTATMAAVDEPVFTEAATGGGTYRWSTDQYIYNWGTAKNQAGSYWRIGVKLDDGQTYYTNIGLRS